MQDSGSATIHTETERARGWVYAVSFMGADGTQTRLELTISWHDHEEMAGGTVPPSELAEAAVRVLSRHWPPAAITGIAQERLDLSTARRLVPGFVDEIRACLQR